MIVDITKDELTVEWLEENIDSLLAAHSKKRKEMKNLIDYYEGKHSPILNRVFQNEFVPNNKLVNNFPKYITTVAVGYFMGNPISYNPIKADEDKLVEEFKDILKEVDVESVDIDVATSCSMTGLGYELLKPFETDDGNLLPKSYSLDSLNTFVVRDNSVESNPLFGVYYHDVNLDKGVKATKILIATDGQLLEYIKTGTGLELVNSTDHYFKIVPIIEYKNNHNARGDYQDVLSLIDAYNILQSDRINDKEQLIDAILMLKGVNLGDEEIVNNIRENKILVMPATDSDAEWLTKQMTEADVEVLRKNLEDDIHKFSLTPNITDEQFSGNSSGVAMQYKLFGFEQLIKTKERFYQEGLRLRIKGYLNFLSNKNILSGLKPSDIDFNLTNRNLPTNNIEVAQMVSQLKNILSDETLIGQVPFVKDVSLELERIERQEKGRNDSMQKSFGFPQVGEEYEEEIEVETEDRDSEEDREASKPSGK